MRVALVHDWLTGMRGGERCLEHFLALYPEADIYTLLHIPGTTTPEIDKRVVATSFLQRIPQIKKHYRKLLPLFPRAARSVKVEGYDLVISLSHAAAKNVSLSGVGKHVCYCFTPMRYVWDMAPAYLGKATPIAWPLIKQLRKWDVAGAEQVDHFVSISKFVSARIRKYYGRDSQVIYPPVNSQWFSGGSENSNGEAFLYAGAFVPYKGVDVVVDAFNELGLPLWCVGSGPLESSLKQRAGANIHFLGRLSDSALADRYRRAKALIFPAKEDFGIIPIEAMGSGRPVIAGYHGATRETIIGYKPWSKEDFSPDTHSGVFYRPVKGNEMNELIGAVQQFLAHEGSFLSQVVRSQAERFTSQRFFREWYEFAKMQGIPVHSEVGEIPIGAEDKMTRQAVC